MNNPFKSKKLLLKIYNDKIELIDLIKNKSIIQKLNYAYFEEDSTISEFKIFEKQFHKSLKKISKNSFFLNSFHILIQPKMKELTEPERKFILNACEKNGVKKAGIFKDYNKSLTNSDAIKFLKEI